MTLSLPDSWTFDLSVSQEHEDALIEELVAFNASHAPRWEQNHDGQFTARPLHLFLRDAEKRMVGGLIGRTHSLRFWFEVSLLWVEGAHRGQGLGRALMERAETEAIRQGCLYARLSTNQYQAPEFYEKVGYVLYGKLENCPPGDTSFYYRKDLTPQEKRETVGR